MNLEDLKNKVKNTILIPPNIKEKLLKTYPWNEKIINFLNIFFKKYGHIEEKIVKLLPEASHKAILKSIKDLEEKNYKEELKEIIELEKNLKKL